MEIQTRPLCKIYPSHGKNLKGEGDLKTPISKMFEA